MDCASQHAVRLLREGERIHLPTATLVRRLIEAQSLLDGLIHTTLTQNQIDALISLVIDVLCGVESASDLKSSALIRLVNKRHFWLASAEFHRWCYIAGKVNLPALEHRRAEARLFLHCN